jgi:rhamnogalacturonan acetylesterase
MTSTPGVRFLAPLAVLTVTAACSSHGASMPTGISPDTRGDASSVDAAAVNDAAPSSDAPNYPDGVVLTSSCARMTDPTFNLDLARPRVDPTLRDPALTTLFVVGDSTVKNHNIKQEGWGDLLDGCFDGSKIQILNWAREGRSSRSFIEEGLWAKVLTQMKAGDYVTVQFGHNDQNPPTTTGSLAGTDETTQTVVSTTTGQTVVVHTYGWYLRQYATDVAAKAAHLIYVTPVPRNYWLADGTMNNTVMAQYVGWMTQVGQAAQLPILDLNAAMVSIYTTMGRSAVAYYFTSGDNTHTNLLGAERIAAAVVDGVGNLGGSDLKTFLLPKTP